MRTFKLYPVVAIVGLALFLEQAWSEPIIVGKTAPARPPALDYRLPTTIPQPPLATKPAKAPFLSSVIDGKKLPTSLSKPGPGSRKIDNAGRLKFSGLAILKPIVYRGQPTIYPSGYREEGRVYVAGSIYNPETTAQKATMEINYWQVTPGKGGQWINLHERKVEIEPGKSFDYDWGFAPSSWASRYQIIVTPSREGAVEFAPGK